MNNKKILLIILILICVITSFATFKQYDKVKIEEIENNAIKNNKFVFQVQQDDGSYKEYLSGSFPSNDYLINTDKTKCTGLEDNVITPTITYENGTVTVTGKNTVYCEIFFDKCKGPVGTVLADKEKVSKCEVGGMYRYQGTDSVDNYICFGTTDQETCKNNASKYMYRIIGVTPDNQLKIILDDYLKNSSGSNISPGWGYTDYSCGSTPSRCVWNGSYLFNILNDLDSSIDVSIRFKGNSYYAYLNNSTWTNLIEESHKWKFGDIIDSSRVTFNGYEMYDIENAFSDTVQAPFGAIYIYDYLLSYPGGNPGDSSTAAKSWLIRDEYPYWTMTRNDRYDNTTNVVYRAYRISTYGIYPDVWDPDLYARPVFYLNGDVKIKSGSGSSIDPYILDVNETGGVKPDPGSSEPAPSCTISVTSSGVTLNPIDATEYGLVKNSSSPDYNNTTSLGLSTGEFYGYVKNSAGTGSCRVSIVYTNQGNSGSDYYTWTESTCTQTGTTSIYNCCKPATSSGSTCPSGYSKVGSYCAKNGTSPTTCPYGTTFSDSVNLCRSYTSFVCPDGYSDAGNNCNRMYDASITNYGNLQQCTKQCTMGTCNGGTCIACKGGGVATTQYGGNWQCIVTASKNACPDGYSKGSNQCWKNSGSPTCGSKTNINGTCYDTTNPTSGGYTCSSSSDSLNGSQCCRSSSSTLSGYSCSVTSSTATYGWGPASSGSGLSCPQGVSSCSSSTVGQKQVSSCQIHSSGGVYYYCSDTSYSKLNDTYCYKNL